MKRLAGVVLFVFLFAAAFTHLERVYSQKFFDVTRKAQWIWAPHRLSDNVPVAFFAARNFDLPRDRYYTHIKVLGDPEYTLYLNGRELAGRRVGEERKIDVFDVSDLAITGRNRLVIAVRATQGVGGLIASIDISPELESWVVTDRRWKIYRRWNPEILRRDGADLGPAAPMILGEPPVGRWDYLTPAAGQFTEPVQRVAAARASTSTKASVPVILTRGGVAIVSSERMRATIFDFGFIRGRVQLTIGGDRDFSRSVNVRFANAKEELSAIDWNLRSYVFAAGERVVVDPEVRSFRYLMVYGADVRTEVLQ
ncbi:MAG TPA: hypothetical protein VN181_12645 [Thermoanaerobaculia bacterium]|nr:hypothetical protein [Thermoanaerobaculia bacterium]